MAGLGRLSKFPPEILGHILDELCVHHVCGLPDMSHGHRLDDKRVSVKALYGLCRASKQLNQLTAWRLYHSLPGWITQSRWMLIARTLIKRSDLAAHVRHLYLTEVAYPPSKIEPEVVDYCTEKIMALGPGALLNADMDSPADDAFLPNGMTEYDAAIALMPSLCPNLSTVVFTASRFGSAFLLCTPDSTPLLSDVKVTHWDTEGSYDIGYLSLLFEAAPNIKMLRLLQACCHKPMEDYAMLEYLTDLHLEYCCMPKDGLDNMLSSLCPNLRRLEYRCGGALYGDEQFGPQEAATAVIEHAPDLEEFELRLGSWVDIGEFTEDDTREAKRMLEEHGIECKFTVYV
jgi:hypothetical protein